MENSELVDQMIDTFVKINKKHFFKIFADVEGLSQNEKIILVIMYENNNKQVSLSKLREKMKLAPSSITAIITSLEKKELIKRVIDKNDRRNIFIKLSKKGCEYTNRTHNIFKSDVEKYVKFMGKSDTEELIRLVSKSMNYFDERRKTI